MPGGQALCPRGEIGVSGVFWRVGDDDDQTLDLDRFKRGSSLERIWRRPVPASDRLDRPQPDVVGEPPSLMDERPPWCP